MAYKKGLTRPATESRHNIITVSGELLETILKIKHQHHLQDKMSKHMNKGEIANRIITDYYELCQERGFQIPFEIPYNVESCRNLQKVYLARGTTIVIGLSDGKIVKSLTTQIFVRGKALELINITRKYMIDRGHDPNIPLIATYYLERHVALVNQLGMDYIEQYKKKYRLI